MSNVLVTCPSYKGISDAEIRERVDAAALERAGHTVSAVCARGVSLLDAARNELMTAARRVRLPLILMIDDDVSIDAESIELLIRATGVGVSIGSAPCKMRKDGHEYNCAPLGDPFERGGVTLIECAWTGLGAVMVRLEALDALHDRYPELHYQSIGTPDVTSCGIFNSMIVPARKIDPDAPADVNYHFGDDRAFSLRARDVGLAIHAVIDARTKHRDMEWSSLGVDLRERGAVRE